MDPFAQLDLASRIAHHALAAKAAQLEAEGQQLRDALVQKQNHIKMMERRVSNLELDLQEMAAKVRGWRVTLGHGQIRCVCSHTGIYGLD